MRGESHILNGPLALPRRKRSTPENHVHFNTQKNGESSSLKAVKEIVFASGVVSFGVRFERAQKYQMTKLTIG